MATVPTYSYAQLEGLWINAGGAPSMAPIMAAIAEAESGGNPQAYNASGATGLWQILGAVNSSDQGSLTNPTVNAHEAVLKYQTQGLGAWVTYTSGAYKAFMQNSTTPDTSVSTPAGTSETSGGSTSAGSGPDCAISFPGIDLGVTSVGAGCLVTYSTERALIAGLMLGVAGIVALAGLVILAAAGFGSTGAGRVVEAVTPVGRVVSAVTPKRS
jgi:hypothetical protein